MTPKFLILHRFVAKSRNDPFTLESDDAADRVIMVNPRRADYFEPMPPPTAQPGLYCGTRVQLGSNKCVVVQETIADIKRMLKK